MPPRIPVHPPNSSVARIHTPSISQRCRYASVATATTPAPSIDQMLNVAHPISLHPPNQPPSYKPPHYRKSQLLRQYTSLLRSSPLILMFQHNNLKAVEWMSIRRELAHALRKVDAELSEKGNPLEYGPEIKIQIVQTSILKPAMRIVEFYNPVEPNTQHPTDPRTASSAQIPDAKPQASDPNWTHALSSRAHRKTYQKKLSDGMESIVSGPIALVHFPAVTPQHLAAVLSILAPTKEFPAPKRRARPSYHEATVQNGLQKLILLAARVEGKVFDQDGVRWVGGIEGGIDGLRAQLVAMLSGVGAQITNTLESAGRSVYLTMEGRRGMLEEEQKKEAEPAKS